MELTVSSATILTGMILGWSVAWPPGPVNAEIIRRGILPATAGGGFWSGLHLGLGACAGDFLWALGVCAGAGAILNTPAVRLTLGALSLGLLVFLAGMFARSAWRMARRHPHEHPGRGGVDEGTMDSRRRSRGFLLGFTFAMTSPWSMAFWLAVVGSQTALLSGAFVHSIILAASVVLGAVAWTLVLCITVKLGARIFSRPAWQICTQALTAVIMLYFAARLAMQLR